MDPDEYIAAGGWRDAGTAPCDRPIEGFFQRVDDIAFTIAALRPVYGHEGSRCWRAEDDTIVYGHEVRWWREIVACRPTTAAEQPRRSR